MEAAELHTPTETEVRSLLGKVEPDRAVITLMAGTGLRRGEALALRWPDVELKSKTVELPDGTTTAIPPHLRVEGLLQRAGGELRVLPPKTERSRRRVPLPVSLVTVLKHHRKEQTDRQEIAGEAWHAGHYVFDRGDGRPLDPDALGAAFRRAREKANVSCRLHDLRHAYATRLVKAKTNARVVSDVMGHATVAFTLQTYYSPGNEELSAVAATIETAIGSRG